MIRMVEQKKSRGMDLHHRITLGMIVGLVVGIGVNALQADAPGAHEDIMWWAGFFGKDIFVGILKMLIAPLILASIVSGVTSLPDSRELGNIGWKTFGFYVMTTTIAVGIGIAMVLLISPGTREASQQLRSERQAELDGLRQEWLARHPGVDLNEAPHRAEYLEFVAIRSGSEAAGRDTKKWSRMSETSQSSPREMFKQKIVQPILSNPFRALAETNAMGIITFAILLGLACVVMGEPARPVVEFFRALNDVIMKVTLWVMELAPYCIACLLISVVGELGVGGLKPLAWYSATVVGGIAVHLIVLITLVKVLGRMSPRTFIKGIRNAWMIAFTTTSSSATLPVTMECVTDNLKVDRKVAGFTLPVGATVNMDGTALYEGIAVIFMLQVYNGLDDVNVLMTGANILVIFMTAVLASVGAASIPSAGLVTMTIVATAVGLPVHYIVYLWTIDHVLDMFRTSTNITGDAAASVVVNHWERDRLAASAP